MILIEYYVGRDAISQCNLWDGICTMQFYDSHKDNKSRKHHIYYREHNKHHRHNDIKSTTAISKSKSCSLYKISEISELLSQSLKFAHLRFEAQRLVHLSKIGEYTFHKQAYRHSTTRMSCCNNNELLENLPIYLEDFATIFFARNTRPIISMYDCYLYALSRNVRQEIIILQCLLHSRIGSH